MPQQMRNDTRGVSHWCGDKGRVLAAILHVLTTKEFLCVAFARDSVGRYRPFQRSHFLPSARAGELALKRDLGRRLLAAQVEFPATDVQLKGVDLFGTLPNVSRYHDAYVMLRDGFNQSSARGLLEEISRWVPDLDGNWGAYSEVVQVEVWRFAPTGGPRWGNGTSLKRSSRSCGRSK